MYPQVQQQTRRTFNFENVIIAWFTSSPPAESKILTVSGLRFVCLQKVGLFTGKKNWSLKVSQTPHCLSQNDTWYHLILADNSAPFRTKELPPFSAPLGPASLQLRPGKVFEARTALGRESTRKWYKMMLSSHCSILGACTLGPRVHIPIEERGISGGLWCLEGVGRSRRSEFQLYRRGWIRGMPQRDAAMILLRNRLIS